MPDFHLRIGTSRYTGWKTLTVTRTLEELAHTFQVGLTDQWEEGQTPVPIEAGDSCVVLIDDEEIVTGYIDEDVLSYSSGSRELSFSGRSKTGDLVDCAAIHKGGQWQNVGLLQIAKDICSPFGISVSSNVLDLGATFKKPDPFVIEEGETAFECLARGAAQRGVMMLTDKNGNLFFDRAGSQTISTVLQNPGNILSGSKVNSWVERFSQYTLKVQSAGGDEFFGKATSLKHTSSDSGLGSRYRPTTILADNEDSGTELKKRADWERNIRTGKAKRLSYTVQGWKHSGGLWTPNTIVRVVDPWARIDDRLLIVSTQMTRSAQGTLTTLELTFPEAFNVLAIPPKKQKSLI